MLQRRFPWYVLLLVWLAALTAEEIRSTEPALRQIRASSEPAHATLRVRSHERSSHVIPREMTGKFAEHLGWNIYHGMDAQILRNPTFAEYPFWNGQMSPDGVTKFHVEDARINEELRRQAVRFGWPESDLNGMVQARADALACFWTRVGSATDVQVSPDTGPHGGRAQRVQIKGAGQGIAQWTWLPLHRQRAYEFEIMGRSPELQSLEVAIWQGGSGEPLSSARVEGLLPEWRKFKGRLVIPAHVPADASYKFTLTADRPGQFVIRHVFLRPVDHIGGADPEVVRLLKDSHLPILRWPGGNFVSTYHWEDGIGAMEGRPTEPNYAWGGLELNTFGTDEFIVFCRAVGCEPMICINAGSDTPESAARWIEYCNGPVTSPMGRLRAANGHPEPFRVRHWEVGNELWGRWQMRWTTAAGYVDRFRPFAAAMLAADPTIELYSCGAPVLWGKDWNDTLIAGLGSSLGIITDHPLVGGNVMSSSDPLDIYRDFMAVPEVLEQKWAGLRDDMRRGGIEQPGLAVTELQLFAHLKPDPNPQAPVLLTAEKMLTQATMTEALYDVLIYHAAIRLTPFVRMVTHSATVNHGGGLRKERERVWANPCHYAQAAFAAFAEATPVAVEIETTSERAAMVLPDLKNAAKEVSFGTLDALAAIGKNGHLLISLVHRGTAGPIDVTIHLPDFVTGKSGSVRTLGAAKPWESNSREVPNRVAPVDSTVDLSDGKFSIAVQPYSLLRIDLPPP